MNDTDWNEYFDSAASGLRPCSDFGWYAVDQKGQIALFTSAGFGAIPPIVFQSKSSFRSYSTFLEGLVTRCDYIIYNTSGNRSDWIQAAQQGLFGYDWDSALNNQHVPEEPYRLITAPMEPLLLKELPSDIQTLLSPVRFSGIAFDETREIRPANIFPEDHFVQ
jgi:hypothetical protein